MQNSSVTRLDDTSYSVTAKFKGREWSDDSTTFEICATLSNGTTCCDTFRIFVGPTELVAPDYALHTFHSQLRGAIDYKILDSNATLVATVPPLELNVEVYDDYGNSLRTLHNEVPVSPEGTIYYRDSPMPLNNIVFQWGDKIVTVRVVKISK